MCCPIHCPSPGSSPLSPPSGICTSRRSPQHAAFRRPHRERAMLRKIAAFELRYQLRSPLFLICFAIFFIFTLVSVVSDRIQIGARGNVHVNSPFAIMQTNGTLTLLALFVLVAFVANAVIRDDHSGFAPIIRTTRITKFDYLLGRFLGAWLVSVIVVAAVPLAIFLGSFSPTIDPQKLGPNVAWFYVSST